jgi:hypothetical protein
MFHVPDYTAGLTDNSGFLAYSTMECVGVMMLWLHSQCMVHSKPLVYESLSLNITLHLNVPYQPHYSCTVHSCQPFLWLSSVFKALNNDLSLH